MRITFDLDDERDVAAVRELLDLVPQGPREPIPPAAPPAPPAPATAFPPFNVPSAPPQTDPAPPPPPAPTVSPSTSAPATAPPSATPPAPEGDLDSAGRPWDPEVHAASKSKTKDGKWRFKRGLSKEAKAAYKSQGASAPTPPAASAPPPPPPPPPVPAAQGASPVPAEGVEWSQVMTALQARRLTYSEEQIQGKLREAGIDPLKLHETSAHWGLALETLRTQCPM